MDTVQGIPMLEKHPLTFKAQIDTSPAVNLKINHLGISVPDLEAAVQWYTENLGFCQLQGLVHFKRDEAVERAKDKHIFHSMESPTADLRPDIWR